MRDKPAQPASKARAWIEVLNRYREPNTARSVVELTVTAIPYALLWTLMWAALSVGYWLCLILAVPAAAFLMRLFMIQHDCGHGSFFSRRAVNDWVGRVLGVVTLTPYAFWARTHAIHHASVGNLDQRGVGDVITLTVAEYRALQPIRQVGYQLYRHPLVMFGLVPAYLFLLHYRLPFGLMGAGMKPWLSTMGTNAMIAMLCTFLIALVGVGPFLMIQLPITLCAASIAVWFFYVQHQFEDTQWAHAANWSLLDVALHGSSHYELPRALAWFTGNIGVHHVHHLCSRIPSYRLGQVITDYPELASTGRVRFWESLRCSTLALWDEEQAQLISFQQLRARLRALALTVPGS